MKGALQPTDLCTIVQGSNILFLQMLCMMIGSIRDYYLINDYKIYIYLFTLLIKILKLKAHVSRFKEC